MKLPFALPHLSTLGAWLLGGCFIYAAYEKIYGAGPKEFQADVRSFHLLHDPWPAVVALFLPWLEIITGLAVFTGVKRRAGAVLQGLMLLAFIGALASAAYRGIDITCGCFGKAEGATNLIWAVTKNVLLLLLVGYVLGRAESPTSPQLHPLPTDPQPS